MRLGNLRSMLGVALLVSAVGCRSGNDERGTSSSDRFNPYARAEDDARTHDRYGNTDKYGSSSGKSGQIGGIRSTPAKLTGDATADFTAKSAEETLTGIAAFTTVPSGVKLVVVVSNAKPGHYNIILRKDGACDVSGAEFGIRRDQTTGSSAMGEPPSGYHSSDTLGSQDESSSKGTTSSKDTSGSRTAVTSRINLGELAIGDNGRGHFEGTFSERQLNNQNVSALENQALMLRQQSQSMTDVGAKEQSMACGIITLTSNRASAG